MKYKFYDKDGVPAQEREVAIPVLEENKGEDALRQVCLAYLANARQGSACTKTRGEVSGTGKKPWRQKGTGNARHGSRRSPIWVGGAPAFGPKPRDYSQKLNSKVRKLALLRAIHERSEAEEIQLVESFGVDAPKTKLFNQFLDKVCPEGTVLLVDISFDENVLLAARNIPRVYMVDARSINALDFGNYKQVLMTEEALAAVVARVNN